MRYGWVKTCALVMMGAMLIVIAACTDNQESIPVHGKVIVENSCNTPDAVDEVLDGVYALYPENAPALPQAGAVNNLMIAYHVPGMEHVHGFDRPVQFYFEYLYSDDGMMAELKRIRDSLNNVEYDDENKGRIFLTGTAGHYVVNITAFLKEGPDSMHYSIEMPEEYVDTEAFVQKVRTGPIGDMVHGSIGDVEYTRHVFPVSEQWVWGYLTDMADTEMVTWYQDQAAADGYTGIMTEEGEDGVTLVTVPGLEGKDAWTAQVQVTDRGYTYVCFSMVHTK